MNKKNIKIDFQQFLFSEKSIVPLLTFRVLFGLMMFWASMRYFFNGWIQKLYIEPGFHFKYFGFHWVENPGEYGVYTLFAIKAAAALFIAAGFYYRVAVFAFLFSFAWIELIDASNYLNHHYLVFLFALFLLFVPANRVWSLDLYFKRTAMTTTVPAWCLHIFMVQISMVYFFAGWAKLSSDWLLHAMPLRIWLPQYADWNLVGGVLALPATAFLFSWFGAIYDLTIWVFLWIGKTRLVAYLFVLLFHSLTAVLFNIGIFPWVMILSNLIFFSSAWHEKIWSQVINLKQKTKPKSTPKSSWLVPLLSFYFFIQLILPFRHLLYPGKVWWTEEGYRFSWRVMLLEKFGQASFFVEDPATGQKVEVINSDFLTGFQEKQMAIQPDFILQFAKALKDHFETQGGMSNPRITADVYVAVNGRPSKRFVYRNQDLAAIEDGWQHKEWVKTEAF